MKNKLLTLFLTAGMICALLSGTGFKTRAEDNTDDKAVNFLGYTEFTNVLPDSAHTGYVHGYYGADAAYLGEIDGKVKFMISGVVGLVDKEKVRVCALEGSNLSHYKVVDGKLLHYISENIDEPDLHPLMAGPAPECLDNGVTYYSYDGHYFYEDYSVMLNDYRGETRDKSVNKDDPYFNYYQYLPLRTKTVYSKDEFTGILNDRVEEISKLKDLGGCFVDNQDKYGVNALLAAGVAINESDWGRSKIARERNNLFGLRAFDSDPEKGADIFDSPEQCVEEFTKICMSKNYADPRDWRYNGLFLGDKASGINVRYASDPYWGEKAAGIAWKLDMGNNIDKKDRYRYTLGIKDTVNDSDITDLKVRKEGSADSAVIYETGERPYYPFVILGEENGFYKVQSDPPLTDDRNAIADVSKETGTGEYDFETMYLYASKDHITLIKAEAQHEPEESGKLGDVNGDGDVDIVDARWLLQASSGNRTLNPEQKAVADVNKDENIDIVDARWLLQASSGNRTL